MFDILQLRNRKGQQPMRKTSTDELVKNLSSKKKKTTPVSKKVSAFIERELWNGRPTQWLSIGITYLCVAYTTYRFATYYIGVPQFTGMAAFVATCAILSRTFKK